MVIHIRNAVLVVMVALCPAFGGSLAADETADDVAKEIHAIDWLNTDEALSLESLRGKVVLVDFWATYCCPCIDAMPHVNALAERHAADGLVVIGLTSEDAKTVCKFVKKSGKTCPSFAVGCGSKTWREYGVRSIPHSIVIGADGTVAWRGHPRRGLDEAVVKALAEAGPSPKQDLAAGSKAVRRGDYRSAATLLKRVIENTKATEDQLGKANALMTELNETAQAQLDGAMALLDEGHQEDAASMLRFLADQFASMEVGATAEQQLLAMGG